MVDFERDFFKLYLHDVGVLGAGPDIPPTSIILGNYGITKGFFIENYAAMELLAATGGPLFSWIERNSGIEFLLVKEDRIIPVEVKSGARTKAQSLQRYIRKYQPQCAIVLSEKLFSVKDGIKRYVPLVYADKLPERDLCG